MYACPVTSVVSDSLWPHCSLTGSSVYGIFQARTLEWVAMPSPPCSLHNPGIKSVSPASPALQVDSLRVEPLAKPHISLALSIKVHSGQLCSAWNSFFGFIRRQCFLKYFMPTTGWSILELIIVGVAKPPVLKYAYRAHVRDCEWNPYVIYLIKFHISNLMGAF